MKNRIRLAILLIVIAIFPIPTAQAKQTPSFYARSVILIEIDSGRVLYEKQAHTRIPMASTTKIMTALIVLEKANMDDIVTVSKRAAQIGGSTMNLELGEKISVMGLMYGLMLRSGNDAAIALAEHVAGSVEEFCEMMNQKAREIGAYNTNFVSPHGLDHHNHYTTAADLALITKEAMKNDLFRKIIATKTITIDGHTMSNTNNLLYANNGIDGVKTGYTSKAGRCIVITAERNGMRIIGVILGCDTTNKRTADALKMTEFAYDNYQIYTLYKANSSLGKTRVEKGKKSYVNLVVKEDVRLPLDEEEYEKLEYEVIYEKSTKKAVYKDDILGELVVKCDDDVLYSCYLYADSTCKKKNFLDYMKEILNLWLYPIK
ncbi:MAG: D-alanyl-D-alanine carboxypeptidase [Clostridiaceae bacterium]|nr:D-alanyl-D-alanine carboxypeptidase [Clostridiaceae bacterium]